MNSAVPVSRVTIERWVNTYLVDKAARDMRHADRCVVEEMPEACAKELNLRLDVGNPAVWRIRELRLELLVNIRTSAMPPITSWSEHAAASISAIIDRGAQTDSVMFFEDYGAYLAQFALDVAAGRAWNRWYYEEFAALRSLPTGRAVVEAFSRDSDQGAQALVSLARAGRLDEMLDLLSGADASLLYQRCFKVPSAPGGTQLVEWCGRLLAIRGAEPMRWKPGQEDLHRDAIQWLARAAVRYPEAVQESAAHGAVEGLLELRRTLTEISSPFIADRVIRALLNETSGISAASQLARREGASSPEPALQFLREVAGDDPHWAAQAAAVLLHDRQPTRTAGSPKSMVSSFAGIFLLGPAFVELGLSDIGAALCRAEPGLTPEGERRSAFYAHVLSRCLGGERAKEALRDRAVLTLAGCPGVASLESNPLNIGLDLDAAWQVLLKQLLPSDERSSPSGGTHLTDGRPDSPGDVDARRPPTDVDALAFLMPAPPSTLLARDIDVFCAVVARCALRRLAVRLKGFQSSSPQHVARNFLAGTGTVRIVDDGIEVELPHSPLSMMLQFSGLARQRYSVPWLEGCEIWLQPPRE